MMIKTNIGELPVEDYLDIKASQYGGRELETGICRLMDSEMDGDTTKGSLLDFIW